MDSHTDLALPAEQAYNHLQQQCTHLLTRPWPPKEGKFVEATDRKDQAGNDRREPTYPATSGDKTSTRKRMAIFKMTQNPT